MEQRAYAQRDQQEELRRRMLGEKRREIKRKTDQESRSAFDVGVGSRKAFMTPQNVDEYRNRHDLKNQEKQGQVQEKAPENRGSSGMRPRIKETKKLESGRNRGLESQRRELLNSRRSLANADGQKNKIRINSKINAVKRKVSTVSDIAADSKVLLSVFINPLVFFQLLGQIDLLKDGPFIAALIASGGDDFIIDWSGITDLAPGTGSVVSSCINIFNGFMILMASQAEGGDMDRMKRQMLRRAGLLIASTAIELFPFLDILPTEVAAVALIYVFVLAERKRKKDRQERIARGDATEEDEAESQQKMIESGNLE